MAEKTDNKNQEDDEPREQDTDNLKRMKQVVKNVISNCYANLSESLSGCLSDFANKMLSEQLITDSVMRKRDFNEIIGDYKAGISTIFKYTELQGYCSKLLDVLRSLGGPVQRTADYLESELNKSFQEKFGHFLFPQPREVRINSSPSISSCPPTTKRPYASDSNFFKIYISEINPIQDQPSVKNNQITEESTSPDPSCPTFSNKSSFSVPDSFIFGKSLDTTLDKPTEEDSGVPHTVQSDNLVPGIAMATEKENEEFYLSTSAEETNTNVSCRTDQTIITTNNNKPAAGTNPPSEHLSMVKDKEDNPSYTNGQKELDDLSDGERDGHVKTSCIYVPPGSLLSQLPTQLPQNDKIRSDELQQPYIPITLQENESIQHQATSDNTGIHKRKQDILATDVIQRECKGYEEVKHDEIYMSISNEISTKKSTLLSTDETIATRPYIVIIITILFSFLLFLPYMGKQTLPSPLIDVEILASTRLLVAGGQHSQLHWEEYGLILDIPDNALPPGFIAEIIIHVSVSGPYVYPDSESWKLASAVYWISSSKDFINPVKLGLWHSAKGLQNGSNLRIVTAQDEVRNSRRYIFEDVSEIHTVDGSFVYCYINHFSNFAVLSETDQYFDGCLLYQESPKSAVTWIYSFVVYKSHPDGIIERLLDKASYTGWTIDIIESGVKFKNNNSVLTLNVRHNLKEWEIIAKNPPLTYEKDEILRHQSIRSNMQFFLHWAGQGPPTTQFVKLSLVGAKKPTSITFETNSGHDKEGNKVRGASGGIISSTEELLLCSRDVHQVLLLCQYLDIELPDCKKIEHENQNLEEQKVNVFGMWLDRGEQTWRDFIRALAKLSQCVVAKELAKKHNVYYFNSDIALEMCKDLNY